MARPWEALRGEDHGFWLGLMPSDPRSRENTIKAAGYKKASTGSLGQESQRRRGGQLRGGRAGAGCEQGAWRRWRGKGEKRGSSGTKGEMLPRVTLPELARMSVAHVSVDGDYCDRDKNIVEMKRNVH